MGTAVGTAYPSGSIPAMKRGEKATKTSHTTPHDWKMLADTNGCSNSGGENSVPLAATTPSPLVTSDGVGTQHDGYVATSWGRMLNKQVFHQSRGR